MWFSIVFSFDFYQLKRREVLCNMGIIFNCLHYLQSSNYHFEITINTTKVIYFKSKKILRDIFMGSVTFHFISNGHGTEWPSCKVLENS